MDDTHEHHLTLTDLLQQRTARELRMLLTARGLSTHGNKHCMLWRLLRFAATSAGRAACGQVWHQTMRRCAACNEVAYCSPVCQRHHWSRHKAACKRARERERLKYDPTVIG